MTRLAAVSVLAVLLLAPPLRGQAPDEGARLHAFLDAEWEWSLEQNPLQASFLGDRRYNDRWSDVSIAAIERRHAHLLDAHRRLLAIDRARLSEADRLNYDLYARGLERQIDEHKHRLWLIPLDHGGGIQSIAEYAALLRFQSVKDYDDWIARMQAFPALTDQTIALMRVGAAEGRMWPRVTLDRVPSQIEGQIFQDPTESPFYAPFQRIPDSIPAVERERLQAAAARAIATSVIPSYRRLHEFFVEDYLPRAPVRVGIGSFADGAAAYAALARRYTTTDRTPAEIHEIGLREVARIRAEMETIRKQVGFEGDLAAFFTKLRTDPQFYYDDPEELLEGYRAISKRIDPELVKVFRTLPRIPYGVVPIPDASAPDTTTAYYMRPAGDGTRPGLYYVNLYKPETRPKWEMMALSLHEAVPGHHLQIALAQELGELPEFRRYGGYTAYVEGWGLYAESLGDDMGLYDDPYSKFGQLTYEMWRAVRLVVDTGIHVMGWSRERAIEYFLANAAKTELDVTNEIDRYITNPGQALAYKTGELKLKELRARAAARLGEDFDIREFHEVVLGAGAIPLDLLEQRVDAWLASKPARQQED